MQVLNHKFIVNITYTGIYQCTADAATDLGMLPSSYLMIHLTLLQCQSESPLCILVHYLESLLKPSQVRSFIVDKSI